MRPNRRSPIRAAALLKAQEVVIAPSLLSADFACLGEEVQEVEKGKADWLHVDVMDGHFVPNLTLGPIVVEALRSKTELPLDCHLMVESPERWIEPFARAGADLITVHAEATVHLDRQLRQIRDVGCAVGVSINPGTPLSAVEEILDLVDLVLIMTVNPGFGGQSFIPSAAEKIRRLASVRENRPFLIQVDGGVTAENAGELRAIGADVLVAGSAIFRESDRAAAIRRLREAARGSRSGTLGRSSKRRS